MDQAVQEIEAARAEAANAFQTVLEQAEAGLAHAASPIAAAAFNAIIFACAAEDIIGQRLGRAVRLLTGAEEDPMLRGPAFVGQGLGQDAADALFADDPSMPPGGTP